jgi:dihydrofolate reductase
MRLTVTSHLTLDGVMQSNGMPEPELNDGFEQGGWQVPYFDHDMDRLTADWIAAADAFLLGRRTYELFAKYWSQVTDPDDPRATRLNALPKYVVSTTLDRVRWHNSVLLQGDVAEEVAKLKRQPGSELQVHGSAALVRTLMKHGLVDEYRLLIHPVVLGNGKRLFADGTTPAALELIDTKTTGRGVVAHIYQPSGKPEYGSVAPEQEGDVVKDPMSRQAAT